MTCTIVAFCTWYDNKQHTEMLGGEEQIMQTIQTFKISDVNVEIQGMHIQIVGEIQFNDVHVYNWIAKVVFFEKVSR